jgi:hypothetical protein
MCSWVCGTLGLEMAVLVVVDCVHRTKHLRIDYLRVLYGELLQEKTLDWKAQ